MKEYSVIIQPQFLEELEVILYFFQNRYQTKRKVYTEVRNTVSSLSIFPERYSKINNNFNTRNLRKLPINKYVVIYEVNNEKNEIYLLHIFLQKQDYLNQI